ncbi:RagB/SusD family nutrient uptake outer membrane protein, partial [Mucilaginibacter sp.]|uniref:RagB/SusD family nutrient uptake outer membrane protein n=1 Tax=Mucilaginibacter sp. TaxID=1882438 RepID=UPI002ED5B10E
MKNIYRRIISILSIIAIVGIFACNKGLNLYPQDQLSEAAYFKSASDFKTFANQYYGALRNFNNSFADNPHYDGRADVFGGGGTYGAGINTVPASDAYWTNNYSRIRNCNYLLEKAVGFSDQAGISQFVAEAKFFRAYNYFELLQLYGGVPLITKTLNLDSP